MYVYRKRIKLQDHQKGYRGGRLITKKGVHKRLLTFFADQKCVRSPLKKGVKRWHYKARERDKRILPQLRYELFRGTSLM